MRQKELKVYQIKQLTEILGGTHMNNTIQYRGYIGSVDDYLQMCEAEGRTPEIAYKGSFNIRISPPSQKA
mgnify:CR=1 FL=1